MGCQRDNPAHDQADAGSEEASSSTTTGTEDPSTTAPETTDPETTDPETTDPETTDPDPETTDPETTDTDPETTDTDPETTGFPEDLPLCTVDTRPPLEPFFGTINGQDEYCPELGGDIFPTYVKVVGAEGFNWIVNPCYGSCYECDMQIEFPLGVDGINFLALMPAQANPNNPLVGCYFVEAEYRVEAGDKCVFASMSLFSNVNQNDLDLLPKFVATREAYGLASLAHVSLEQFSPDVAESKVCEDCETTSPEYCCGGDGVLNFEYFYDNSPMIAPAENAPMTIADIPYEFYAQQAQVGVNCEPYEEFSWAIVRGF